MNESPTEDACIFCFKTTRNRCYLNVLGMHLFICEGCTQEIRKGKMNVEDVKERVAELREMKMMA